MSEPEPTPRTIEQLSKREKKALLKYFRLAIKGRISQWDNEREMERILGREIEMPVPDIAACCDNPKDLSFETLLEALGEDEIRKNNKCRAIFAPSALRV